MLAALYPVHPTTDGVERIAAIFFLLVRNQMTTDCYSRQRLATPRINIHVNDGIGSIRLRKVELPATITGSAAIPDQTVSGSFEERTRIRHGFS